MLIYYTITVLYQYNKQNIYIRVLIVSPIYIEQMLVGKQQPCDIAVTLLRPEESAVGIRRYGIAMVTMPKPATATITMGVTVPIELFSYLFLPY